MHAMLHDQPILDPLLFCTCLIPALLHQRSRSSSACSALHAAVQKASKPKGAHFTNPSQDPQNNWKMRLDDAPIFLPGWENGEASTGGINSPSTSLSHGMKLAIQEDVVTNRVQ